MEEREGCCAPTVTPFDDSAENHFKAMDTISNLCNQDDETQQILDSTQIQQLSSRITFLTEWKQWMQFEYKPQAIRINSEIQGPEGEQFVHLPEFSAANIPKIETSPTDTKCSTSKDFILLVGGAVWGLDWCPSLLRRPDNNLKSEFLAVASHPPGSSYHKIGVPLTGRGVVQIWCLLNDIGIEEEPSRLKKQRGRPRKQTVQEDPLDAMGNDDQVVQVISSKSERVKEKDSLLKKARGRPRKQTVQNDPSGTLDSDNLAIEKLVVKSDSVEEDNPLPLKKAHGRPRKQAVQKDPLGTLDSDNLVIEKLVLKSDSVEERDSLPLKKARGRPRKKILKKDPLGALDSDSLVIPELVKSNSLEEEYPLPLKKARGRPRKQIVEKDCLGAIGSDNQAIQVVDVQSARPKQKSLSFQRARGRPKKKDMKETLDDLARENQINQEPACEPGNMVEKDLPAMKKSGGGPRNKKSMKRHSGDLDRDSRFVPPLAFELPKESSALLTVTGASSSTNLESCDPNVVLVTKNQYSNPVLKCMSDFVTPTKKRKLKDKAREGRSIDTISPLLLAQNEGRESYPEVLRGNPTREDTATSRKRGEDGGSSGLSTSRSLLPEDVALPRLALCLAHNGKVVWDVKWRPLNADDSESKHCMGYLAVALGSGALEVWEVPSPSAIKVLYSSIKKNGTDPRFVKLEPVFRCSKLKYGDRQSIPLTVEWSSSSPHDLILAGCHDGTVALWKFSASGSSEDARPLLCFSADTVPITALGWAPDERDLESENVIVTGGHGGLRFWDIRDPYRPLWDLNPSRRVMSLDWLPNPRCVLLSLDDGTLKILSLPKVAYDVPVTGKPFDGTQQQGNTLFRLSFPIWSIQASRQTGQVAYCSADGLVLRFQLTRKAVDKDPARNRAPHFLCGSVTEDDAILTVNTNVSNIPFPMKPINECGNSRRSLQEFVSNSNHAERPTVQKTGQHTLALCYGDDPYLNIGYEENETAQSSNAISKSRKKKKAEPGRNDSDNFGQGENQEQPRTEFEAFPPKIVAMHKVRWNMNKGSERWLCYGGAAGLVRCQEVSLFSMGEN